MLFWIVAALMLIAVLVMTLPPLLRRPEARQGTSDVAFYKAQLAEVDRDLDRDVIDQTDAERVRTEIARRLLAASRATKGATQSSPRISGLVACLIALGVTGVSAAIYLQIGTPGYADMPLQKRIALADEVRKNRPSQQEAEAKARVLPQPDAPQDYLASVARLRETVVQRNDDLQGWALLAYHESRLRNFSDAAKAQSHVVRIKGAAATADDLIRQADLLVAAADGFVSPEAENVVFQVLDLAPNSVAARYYLGAMYDQTDRPDLAFQLWRSILESGAPDSVYVSLSRRQVTGAAFRAGVKYTPPAPELAGPSVEQMMSAQGMDPAAREDMIAGMVDGLARRLATDGGTAAEWARLITAYNVLGETEQANSVLAEARVVFGSSDRALAILEAAAERKP